MISSPISHSASIELWAPEPASVDADLDDLAEVLHECVHGGAGVSFVIPFSHAEAKAFWQRHVLPFVQAGSRCVLVARQAGRIVGTVQLDLDTPPNQPHRAEVRKLLVHPEARRYGIARALMQAIEEQARNAGRTLLTLDTVTNCPAEPLYRSLGYIPLGVIPDYALSASGKSFDAATFMYKPLPAASSPSREK